MAKRYTSTNAWLPAVVGVASIGLISVTPALGAKRHYSPGVTDKEITLGQSVPYSGPMSVVGIYGKVETAYFQMINDEGGINGRKINLISLDNAYSPSKTVEDSRRLVEQDHILAEVGTLGSATNAAVQKYLNGANVPQIFLGSSASRFNDPAHFPWTVPFWFSDEAEGGIYARYILEHKPEAKIGVIYIRGDFGKSLLDGFKEYEGGEAAKLIVATEDTEASDPTIDSQIVQLQASGADTLLIFTNVPKQASQAIRKVDGLGWRPLRIVPNVSSSVNGALKSAGFDKSVGLLSIAYVKTPGDPRLADDPDVKDYFAFMKKYLPREDAYENAAAVAYVNAIGIALVLHRSGDELTRKNLIRQATTLDNVRLPMLMPNITLSNSAQDYAPFHSAYLVRFDGKSWVPLEYINSSDKAASK
jgi:branched-chain amino acid transport system substrate-binding protein